MHFTVFWESKGATVLTNKFDKKYLFMYMINIYCNAMQKARTQPSINNQLISLRGSPMALNEFDTQTPSHRTYIEHKQ